LLEKLLRDGEGNAVVEFSIVLPLLVTLGFGAFEFSNAFFEHQEVTTGIRDAARYFARIPVNIAGADPCTDPNSAASIPSAQNIAVYGTAAAATNPRVQGWAPANVLITCVGPIANPINPATGEPTYRGASQLWMIEASTSFPYSSFGMLRAIGLTTPNLSAAHYERWIGG